LVWIVKISLGEEMKDTTQTTLAEKIADRIFANGAERLVLERPDGRHMGGWCRQAIIDQINEVLNVKN
jgi:hypothetical protein